mgnify:CR=1 FL=1
MGASRIQGITVEIGGDTTKLTAALLHKFIMLSHTFVYIHSLQHEIND